MQAMVLAAGLGTRLWPLTADRAKPAVPFLGKPLIAGILELLEAHGFDRAVVNTHHLPASIHRALAAARTTRIKIALSHETQILGTAGALAQAREMGLLDPDQAVLVVNAKLYTDLDLTRALEAHRAHHAKVTMVLRANTERELFREVLIEDDRVTGFGRSKTPEGPRPLLFTGIHILEPEVVRAIPLKSSDTVADIYPPLIRDRAIAAHVDDRGRWWEFSTLERYLGLHARAHREGLGPEVSTSEGASIAQGAIVERAVLWEDARVEAGAIVRDAVLGRNAVVRAGGIVERAVIIPRAQILDAAEHERGEAYDGDQLRVAIPPPPTS